MEIIIKGTENQIIKFLNNLVSKENAQGILEIFAAEGIIKSSNSHDDPDIYRLLEELSWPTVHLAHIICVHGHEREDRGKFMTLPELTNYALNEDGDTLEANQIRSRVGGANKVAGRISSPLIFTVRRSSKTKVKRYYLTSEALRTLEQYLDNCDGEYRKWLEDMEYSYPEGEEEGES